MANETLKAGFDKYMAGVEAKLAKNPERVYSREMLLSLVWDNAYVDERTVDVHMLRLRKQLQGTRAENLLQTVRGLGYRAHISE